MKIIFAGSLSLKQISDLQHMLSDYFVDDLLVKCELERVIFYSDFEGEQ